MSQHTWDLRDVYSRVHYYGIKGSWHVYLFKDQTYLGQVTVLPGHGSSYRRGWVARTPDGELLSVLPFRTRKAAAISLRYHYEQKPNP